MKHLLFLFILILIPTYSVAQDSTRWTTLDYTLASSLVIAGALDYGITNHGINNCGFHEDNPIFGKNPDMATLVIAKTVTTGGMLLIVKYLLPNPKHRRIAMIVYNAIAWTPVFMNMYKLNKADYSIKFQFSF